MNIIPFNNNILITRSSQQLNAVPHQTISINVRLKKVNMKIINWTLLFLVTFFCCLDSMKANPLQQDTIRDVTYQLYPLGVACRNNDMETIKQLLAAKDEPMAMGNDCYEFDILYTAIYFDKEDVQNMPLPDIRTLITDYIVTNTG